MQKHNGYSKYQKDIIKKITKELGPKTPFKHEKTSSNHLKVLIEGLDKPRYTACTPSDSRSGDNFMADLRCALKAAHLKREPKIELSKRMNTTQLKIQYIENLTASCIKTVRTNIEQYTEKENMLVIQENSISNLKPLRKNLATKIFEQTKRANNHQHYITGADSNLVKAEVLKHLNYMLPNAADYVQALKPKEAVNALSKAVSLANGRVVSPNVEAANESINTLDKVTEMVTNIIISDTRKDVDKQGVKDDGIKTIDAKHTTDKKLMSVPNKNPAEELAAMEKEQAVKNLRRLSRNEGEAMLAYIKIAMEENKQQDLQEVLEMMTCKGITLDMLSGYLENVA